MTPHWLLDIEKAVTTEMPNQWFQHGREDCMRMILALKLAIEGLEFYAKSEDYHRPIWDSDPGSGITLDSTVEKDRGTKAREILEKIKRGDL